MGSKWLLVDCLWRPLLRAAILGSATATVLLAANASAKSGPAGTPAAMFEPVSFTEAQDAQGSDIYAARCASCHGADLGGGAGRPLKGRTFMGRWSGGSSLGALYKYIRETMPPGGAGSINADRISAVMAFILRRNGLKPGTAPLPADYKSLQAMHLPYTGDTSGGLAFSANLPPWPDKPNPALKLTPVTDAMLRDPPQEDWLSWRRTLDGQGFSPLMQITRGNVRGLRLAWSYNLAPGPNAATPLVHDGVLFAYSARDRVDAIDAASGEVVWTYQREMPAKAMLLPDRVKRNIALYGNRLYLATGDNKLVALDVKTGEPVWESPADQPMSAGPLVVSDMVVQGLFRGMVAPRPAMPAQPAPAAVNDGKPRAGVVCVTCGGFGRIIGLSADDGKAIWNFNTVPQPGEPGAESWNDMPFAARSGGSVWNTGSYDPDLDLVFFGTGNTYNTQPLVRKAAKRGVTNDALHTDSTLALRPRTGELVWHFQHQANDQWDLDWAFERMILDLPVKGAATRAIVTVGKMAIIDALQADNGKYLFSIDAGLQNVVRRIDPVTGRKTTDPNLIPGTRTKVVCPAQNGAKNWIPGSYDAASTTLYLPLNLACMEMRPSDPGETSPLSSGVTWSVMPRPDGDGNYGQLQAFDLATRKSKWVARQHAPIMTGVLGTAGGLLFAGGLDRTFSAYDAENGNLLWSTRLGDVPSAAPISFAVDGRQFIAVVAGYGTMLSGGFLPLVPDIAIPTVPSSSLYVFELPQ